ncbi:hypothetical protein B0T21DRAFT_348110 [Apiosordaria backusii]|uniref:Uncharacterized protein n=1 Tax=Apiosordaria backusii TaxID=314023 RepID=A0AA40BKP6_9PEZI|nr:hypothetical protein B0T21DRAFT_348110 [Apiosordaria backusii]
MSRYDSDEYVTESELFEDSKQPFEYLNLELEDQDDQGGQGGQGVRQPRIRRVTGFNGTAALKNWTIFPLSDLRLVVKPLNKRNERNEAFSRAICDGVDPGSGTPGSVLAARLGGGVTADSGDGVNIDDVLGKISGNAYYGSIKQQQNAAV